MNFTNHKRDSVTQLFTLEALRLGGVLDTVESSSAVSLTPQNLN